MVWNRPRAIRSQRCFFVSPRWGKSKNAFWTKFWRYSSIRLFALLRKKPPKMVVWDRPSNFRSQRCFFVSPRWGKSKNAFWTQFDDIRQFGYLRCLEKPTKNGGMRPTSCNSIATVFFRFAPMGKLEKRVWKSILTISVNSAFCAAWKSPPKIVVWNWPRGFRSLRCFFVSPRWEKSKNPLWTKFWRYSSIRLFALLGKAHPK